MRACNLHIIMCISFIDAGHVVPNGTYIADQSNLYLYLSTDYEKAIRPMHTANDVLQVTFGLHLQTMDYLVYNLLSL